MGDLVLVLLLAACGNVAANTPGPTLAATTVPSRVASAAPASLPARTSAAAASGLATEPLSLRSSIVDGAVLKDPVQWIATVAGTAASDPVDHVDFLVDGALAWTEHNVPYQFNDDGNFLVPWVLAPGSLRIGIDAVARSGAKATFQGTVTTSRASVPAPLLARTFTRGMPAGPQMAAGDWSISFGANGVISIRDANGEGATEAFVATADGDLTLFGPANWIVPKAQQGGFCEGPEGIAKMRWKASGSSLTLSTAASDPCPGRSFLFAGAWGLGSK